jgi:hypothetical protein
VWLESFILFGSGLNHLKVLLQFLIGVQLPVSTKFWKIVFWFGCLKDSKKEDTGDIYSPFFEKFPARVAVICFDITG